MVSDRDLMAIEHYDPTKHFNVTIKLSADFQACLGQDDKLIGDVIFKHWR